jgi:Holliday junction resolvase RusA-like endonuclease
MPLIDGPACIDVEFRLPTPKRPAPDSRATKKPDLDNALKVVLDALTDVGIWPDDALVVSAHVRKVLSTPAHGPGATVTLYREATA